MARVRGIAVHGAIRFVTETWGSDAHQRILAQLPAERCGTFLGPLTDGAWKPLGDLGAYLETARRLFANGDPGFYRQVGRFVGRHEREHGGFKPMVADPRTSMRLAGLLWRALYDTGRCDVLSIAPDHGIVRVTGFPASRGLCLSTCGSIEGLTSGDGAEARVDEVACVLDGCPYCEFKVQWD
jgi:hypothetical protein